MQKEQEKSFRSSPLVEEDKDQSYNPLLEKLDVIEISEIRKQALEYFVKVTPEAKDWSQEKLDRIKIQPMHEWGRLKLDSDVYLISQIGEGPNEPLSDTITARIDLYAAMSGFRNKEGAWEKGFRTNKPFATFPVNRQTALSFKKKANGGEQSLAEFLIKRHAEASLGKLTLEKFLAKKQLLKNRITQARSIKASKDSSKEESPKPKL